MKPIFFKTLLFLSFMSAIGCSPTYYKTPFANVPNFRKKGQAYVAAHTALTQEPVVETSNTTIDYSVNIGDVQAAYAITDHLAIQVNYEGAKYEKTKTTTPSFGTSASIKKTSTKGALGECAIGYLRPLNEGINLGLYGGYGAGWVNNNWGVDGASSARLSKFFLQGIIGTNGKYFDMIASAKLARLSYYNLSQTYTNKDYIDAFDVLKTPLTIAEFAIVARFGFKNIKFQLQANSMSLLTTTKAPFEADGLSLGVGICVQFDTKNEPK